MKPSGTAAKPAYSERLARLRRGRWAELAAACLLLSKGYRILALRHRTPYGEIDVIATRWRRIAFIEVKRRRTLDDAYAALTPQQAQRIALAADYWIVRHRRYRDHEIGLDAILIVPASLPRHLPNALDAA
jgi:putative endonuclease